MSALAEPSRATVRRAGALDHDRLMKMQGVFERHGTAMRIVSSLPDEVRWRLLEYVIAGQPALPHSAR